MPLLLCPNDNAGMQTVSRGGVEFDMCPQCRGVWLDRGELEKLMDAATAAAGQGGQPAPPPVQPSVPPSAPQPAPWGQAPQHQAPYPQPQYPQHGGQYGHGGYNPYYGKKKKKLDIFDIFD